MKNEEIDEIKVALHHYSKALTILDSYDHNSLKDIIESSKDGEVKLTYELATTIIKEIGKEFDSSIFGIEKEEGKLKGIIDNVNQCAFDGDIYQGVINKASHLLYFLIKDHPFIDGCKRIAASLFIAYLSLNKILFKDGKEIISNETLASLTLLIAMSNPSEKDIIIKFIKNLLSQD